MKKVLKTITINLLVLVALLAIVDFSSMIIVDTAIATKGIRSYLTDPEIRGDLPNYKNTPWAKKHFQEFNSLPSDYKSFYGWRRKEYKGETINIDSLGIRKTTGAIIKNTPIAVFLGGSTMWGTGANDDGTIPSLFKKDIGNNYNVLNYGESGYSAYQSFIFFANTNRKGITG